MNNNGQHAFSVNRIIMWFYFYILLFICNFTYVYTEFHLYMDNQTLCNQGLIRLENIHIGRIYSHMDYHNKYFYFNDHHCSITILTNKRIWMSIEYFQSNSSSSFPRCTEAKYAGNDDRLQIIDGYKNGSILRIICGKDTDKRFDHTHLILKSSIFTIDWQTKSQSFGFELKFILYDLSIDGQCQNSSSQYQCQNKRCIDQSLICTDEDNCGDKSHFQHNHHCSKYRSKHKLFNWHLIFILSVLSCFFFVIIFICILKICRKQNKESLDGL